MQKSSPALQPVLSITGDGMLPEDGFSQVGNESPGEGTSRAYVVSRADERLGSLAANKDLLRRKKLRGGYYTPSQIVAFLTDWAIQDPGSYCLEPSAGDGEFVAAAARRLCGEGHITAVEIDPREAEKATSRGGACTTVIAGDFFTWFKANCLDACFDAVIGNPPFIRYHDFPEQQRLPAFELMKQEGLKPTRLTNAWLPFVVAATRALRTGGRLALVLPAELLQVMYAAQLRGYLAKKFSQLTVVTFRRLMFAGTQQEIVLLLGIRSDNSSARISFVEINGIEDLKNDLFDRVGLAPVELDHGKDKWTKYYLSSLELGLIRELERSDLFGRLGDYAEIDVGIVTGRNEFFVLTRDEAEQYGLLRWCVPLVGRSVQIPGLILTPKDWEGLASRTGRCYLLQLGDLDRRALPATALAYIERGEALDYHRGYKCSRRLPNWWDVPSVWIPDAFLLRQIHDGPKIVQNCAHAVCTDTIHRVKVVNGTDGGWLAAVSINSLTLAFSEIIGRSYGGGVLELEPSEAEMLPFPRPIRTQQTLDLYGLDERLRLGGLRSVMDEIDRVVLRGEGLGVRDVVMLRAIWQKLSERRARRKL
ncbi:MAG: class I SAM-dependent methyltransferase [Chloroflexi bacterium]|nr:class I SAM-dependent methyltransferase [Chloroflexota bacterium]